MKRKIGVLYIILFLAIIGLTLSSCVRDNKSVLYDKNLTYKGFFLDYTIVADNDFSTDDIENCFEDSIDYLDELKQINVSKKIVIDNKYFDDVALFFDYSKQIDTFSVFLKEIEDCWDNSIKNNKIPEDEEINQLLDKIDNSRFIINDNTLEITGEAKISYKAFINGFIINQILKKLREKNIKDYALNFNSEIFSFGENSRNFGYYDVSPYNIVNGSIKVKNSTLASVSSQLNNYIASDGKIYTSIIDAKNGKPTTDYTKAFVLGDNVILTSLCSYVYFNLTIDEIKAYEKLYDNQALIYNSLNLVYMNDSLRYKPYNN